MEALLQLASDFSPRYEMVRPYLVVVEIGGLGRLLGTPREIGEAFGRVARERGMVVSIGVAATHTAALLLALHHAAAESAITESAETGRLTVVPLGREAAALAPLPLTLLALWPDDRLSQDDVAYLRRRSGPDPHATGDASWSSPSPGSTASPSASSTSASSSSSSPPGKTRGWRGRGSSQHYRLAPSPLATGESAPRIESRKAESPNVTEVRQTSGASASVMRPSLEAQSDDRRDVLLEVLRRWGLKTLGELARLPAADLFERMGRDGIALQQIARGQDARPLVPTTADEPFEATLALDWPIDTLEPLSFVLTRLFEPLCARLERCDRGAAILQVTLQLVTRQAYTRRLELPAPMRDPKVLRTLVLLDLESHPPDAGIDRITLTIDPTPGRIVQHSLLARALPSPEQLSTLTARLTAIMGEGRVGAPVLLDTHRPEAFELRRFEVDDTTGYPVGPREAGHSEHRYVLRRFRRALPARVSVEQGRPVHVTPQGLSGGHVVQAAGPWRTSGEWWKGEPRLRPPAVSPPSPKPHRPRARCSDPWDRDEWDVALSDGTHYRIHLDHRQARWFVEALLD